MSIIDNLPQTKLTYNSKPREAGGCKQRRRIFRITNHLSIVVHIDCRGDKIRSSQKVRAMANVCQGIAHPFGK